jgi:hypothetical protein
LSEVIDDILARAVNRFWHQRQTCRQFLMASLDSVGVSVKQGDTNNGSQLNYSGPLNSISNESVNPTVQVTINGETLINGVPGGVSKSIPNGTVRVNTLSPQLEAATLEIGGTSGSVSLGIGGTVPAYTAAGGSILTRRTETADGQTFSIFPSLQPSVFSRDLAGSIAAGEERTLRDAESGTQNVKTDTLTP